MSSELKADKVITFSIEFEIPYRNEILNYGDIAKKEITDYINKGGYYVITSGQSKKNKRSTWS